MNLQRRRGPVEGGECLEMGLETASRGLTRPAASFIFRWLTRHDGE